MNGGDNISNTLLEKIGNTPIKRLMNYEKRFKLSSRIYAKIEYCNPFGSIKDRSALKMIKSAIEIGVLQKGDTIIEATSGNLGISIAAISNILGYDCKIIMPENMSENRKKLIKAYGAELILTDKNKGMRYSIQKAKELSEVNTNYYYINQFENLSNVEAHLITGEEITSKIPEVDYIICGIGSGGTIIGLSNHFINKSTKIVGVEPQGSPILSKGYAGPHKIQGIGAGFIPKILDISLINDIIIVTDEEAFDECKNIKNTDNLNVGISSGAVLAACKKLCKEENLNNKNIVMIFADSGDRYK